MSTRAETLGQAKLERIVVATHGGASSERALEWARWFHRAPGSRVWVVHVRAGDSAEEARAILERARRQLAAPGVDLLFGYGAPAREIATLAQGVRADVVVVGSHGRSPVERALLGSVADGVARAARCSVLVARTPPPPREVLVAVDGSPAGWHAAETGDVVARDGLSFIHVLEPRAPPDVEARCRELAAASGARDTHFAWGEPAKAILDRADASGADLIVLGNRGLGRVRRALLGSTSARVARDAKASVLVVRP